MIVPFLLKMLYRSSFEFLFFSIFFQPALEGVCVLNVGPFFSGPRSFLGFFFKAIVKINTCLLFTDSEEADVLFHNKRDLSRNRDTLFLIFCLLWTVCILCVHTLANKGSLFVYLACLCILHFALLLSVDHSETIWNELNWNFEFNS